jgi:hypothetical protein
MLFVYTRHAAICPRRCDPLETLSLTQVAGRYGARGNQRRSEAASASRRQSTPVFLPSRLLKKSWVG